MAGGGAFSAFLYGTEVRTSDFSDWYIRNDHGLGTFADIAGTAIRLYTSSVGATDNMFNGIRVQGFQVGWNCDSAGNPGTEGTYIVNSAIIQCAYGILWHNTGSGGGYMPPLLKFINGHMNCFRSWADFGNVSQMDISHNTLELNSAFGHADTGISLTNAPYAVIESNRMFFTNGTRAGYGILAFSGSGLMDIHNNKMIFPGALACIELQAGVNWSDISNNLGTGTGTMINDGGTGNIKTNNRLV